MALFIGDRDPLNLNDVYGGTGDDDSIYGLTGNDTLSGGAGNDYIVGGLGQDTLDGGAGVDSVVYETFNGNGIYDLVAGSANLGVFTEVMLNFENIYTGNGNDMVSGSAAANIIVTNDGDDTIYGLDGNDYILADAGNDTIYGGAGNDTLNGGIGDDYIQGGLGQDTLYGGFGNDTVDYTTFNGFGFYDLGLGTANLTVFTETMSGFENIKIGNGGSITYGSSGDNTITGGAGADYIEGYAGNDTIYGGAGNDDIYGGVGNDYIQGGLGQDYLDGGDGIDTVDYTTFNGDAIYDLGQLAAGNAKLGVFTETMLNFENINVGNGNNTIFGNAANNYIKGGAGKDVIGGFGGDDIISGGAGNDLLGGLDGNDFLYGGAGNDVLFGGVGDDYIQGGLGQDKLDGGAGDFDTVDYTTFNGGGTYDLTAGTAILTGAFTEEMLNFERIYTGGGNNTITGTSGDNVIETGGGIDTIDGLGGDDYVYAGAGNDTINGGAGIDVLFGMDGNDTINGDAGNDDIYGGAGNDTITGGAGDDEFFFYGGALSATNTLANLMGKDTIVDFTKGEDKIILDPATFANLSNSNGPNFFGIAANDTLAASSANYIVYSQDTKTLFYNPDLATTGFEYGGAFAVVNGLASGVNIQRSDLV